MGADPKLRILVVDDDPSMVATLRDILLAVGNAVDVAYSGTEAIESAGDLRPDCVLMDIRMPGPNGVEAWREFRRLSPQSFAIFMTAYSDSALVDEARAEGAVEVLPKPLDLERLLSLIRETAERTPVLIVGDDAAFSDSLAHALAAHGCDVRQARTFDEGLMLYRREPRRAVVLDMNLDQGHAGLDALPLLRQLNPQGVIVLVTGFSDLVEELKSAPQPPVAACLTKPLDVEDLLRILYRELDLRRAGS